MRPLFAIIADDLTGALDSSSPFALAGLTVAVAIGPDALDAALRDHPDVIVVNTATRGASADDAAATVADVASRLRATEPRTMFKKIDSRLKGHVLVETEAMARAFDCARIVVAPGVPEQGRLTVGGAVTGRGVAVPLPIKPHLPPGTIIVDAMTDAELDRIVAEHDWSQTLAVGARGLGAAFARRLGSVRHAPFRPSPRTLFAIGSRDPITIAQIDDLARAAPVYDVPPHRGAISLPIVLRSVDPLSGADSVAMHRFAEVARDAVARAEPDTLVACGGDTALAILDGMGSGVIYPQGEAAPGLPWFLIERPGQPGVRCIVKSGGFGDVDALANLLPK
ncbi:four-carbon acid sugar kinase family protein [Kaistia terrae]|uniref:Four-carbon acid sugar kinase family protein n=1 Tax=Kaistia terrae TaxID=537017 RepID=A0ABW0PUF7_9HYPH|nr:four-carbon acid sugar kinase family protein [Kaistia terrae]MCX5577206.1 four-carbon acid sugar kinase family protein [Kaistia terrae]